MFTSSRVCFSDFLLISESHLSSDMFSGFSSLFQTASIGFRLMYCSFDGLS